MQNQIFDFKLSVLLKSVGNLLISCALVLATSLPGYASSPSSTPSIDGVSVKAIAASEEAVESLDKIRAAIDPRTTSLVNMAEALDFDPDTAIAYVTNEIGMLPYPGSMRGAIGAMETGSASPLDQALLLGGLLEVMGMDVALAHGTLADADVELAFKLVDDVESPSLRVDFDSIKNLPTQKQTAESPGEDKPDQSLKDINFKEQVEELNAKLGATIKPNTNRPLKDVKNYLAKNYVWVRYRNTLSDDWVDVHPAFKSDQTPKTEVTRYSGLEVSDEDNHFVEVELALEISMGGKIVTKSIMKSGEIQISDLASKQLHIAISPVGTNPIDTSVGKKASYFVPRFNGKMPPGGKAFSDRGQIVDVKSLGLSGEGANSAFSDMNSLINEVGTSKNTLPYITNIWMNATYSSPLATYKVKRPLGDFLKNRTGGAISADDAMIDIVLDVNIGESNNARILSSQLDAVSDRFKMLPFQIAAAKTNISISSFSKQPDLVVQENQIVWMPIALSKAAFLPTKFEGNTVLPLTALVSTYRRKTKDVNEVLQIDAVLDLMFTKTLIIEDGNNVRNDVAKLGIMRTFYEAFLVSPDSSMETILKDKLLDRQVNLQSIDSLAALQSLFQMRDLSEIAQGRMQRDFESAGQLLVAKMGGDQLPRWWKVDSSTGELLGMGIDGGSAAEGATFYDWAVDNSVSLAFLVIGFTACTVEYGMSSPEVLGTDQQGNNITSDYRMKDTYARCMGANVGLFVVGAGPSALYPEIGKLTALTIDVIGFFFYDIMNAAGAAVTPK